jgi:spermidine/putrescine transport system permease protein
MSTSGASNASARRASITPVGGELLTAGQLWSRAIMTAGPGIVWITSFLVLPGLLIFGYSFLSRGEISPAELPVTIDNYARFAGRDAFGDFDPAYWIIVGRSVLVSVVTTVVCVVLAYPLSFFIAAHGPRTRNTLLLLVIAPSWINLVIRTYAWMIVFNPDSPVTSLARAFGLTGEGEGLFPSAFAVYIGMVNVFLPFLVLPLYTAVERLDWSLLEAAQDLYATKWQAFWNVILPQTLPGLVAGIILTVIPAFGMYVVPDLLGGAKTALVGNAIAQQFGQSRDWPFGAAISFLVMSLTMLVLYVYSRRAGEQGMRDLL